MMPALRVTFQTGHVLNLDDPVDQPFPTRRNELAAQLTESDWYRALTPSHPNVDAIERFRAAGSVYDMDRAWRDLEGVSRIDLVHAGDA